LWRFRLPATLRPASWSWSLDHWSLPSCTVRITWTAVLGCDYLFILFVVIFVVVIIVVFFVFLFLLGLPPLRRDLLAPIHWLVVEMEQEARVNGADV